jgi:hypothetical protein
MTLKIQTQIQIQIPTRTLADDFQGPAKLKRGLSLPLPLAMSPRKNATFQRAAKLENAHAPMSITIPTLITSIEEMALSLLKPNLNLNLNVSLSSSSSSSSSPQRQYTTKALILT